MTTAAPVTAAAAFTPGNFDPDAFNPHDAGFLRDPYPTYANFRANAPVHFVKTYNSYWVFRYEDVRRVLDDKEDFSSLSFAKRRTDKPTPPAPSPFGVLSNMPVGLFFLDPPRHGQVRPVLDGYLASASADAPTVAGGVAQKILGALSGSRRFELMSTFALPLPSSTVLAIMGVPEGDWPGILQWVGAVAAGHDPTQSASLQAMSGTCAMALSSYFQALIRGTRDSKCPFHAQPGRLLDSMYTDGVGDAPKMSLDEVQATSVNLAVAGFLSASFLIGTGVMNLLGGLSTAESATRQNQAGGNLPIDLLRAHPELMQSAVNEMLRYDSPFQLTDRFVVNNDIELGGVSLKMGDQVSVVLGSANRDATAFENADVFDIRRYANNAAPASAGAASPHLSFGAGIHACYGGPLVERIAPVAFASLLKAFPTIRFAGSPQWGTDPYLRTPSSLPLEIG